MTWARGGRPTLILAASLICFTFSSFRFGIIVLFLTAIRADLSTPKLDDNLDLSLDLG
jgi:hypothetical protein